MIAYLTDVEGRWDKLTTFVDGNPHVALIDGRLQLADDVTFVFGGDAVDRGPHGRRFVALLVEAHRTYGDRVVLLAGNRDINKLRLASELAGAPHPRAPAEVTSDRAKLLAWTLANTMGASKAFTYRATELAASGAPHDAAAVTASFLDDVSPDGPLRAYLRVARLGYRHGATLFLHGGITSDNFLRAPGRDPARDIDGWLARLDEFYREQLAAFEAGRRPSELIAYQTPHLPSRLNQDSVVYARPTDEHGNPHLPAADIIQQLRADGIGRLVVGHTPSGDCPAIVRDGEFELVLADNSYGRIERGSQVALSDATTAVRGVTRLDDGSEEIVRFEAARDDGSPLGRRLDSGHLVKARLERGDYLLFRGLPRYQVEQCAATETELGTLEAPHSRA